MQIENETIISSQCYWKNTKRNLRPHFRTSTSVTYQRKLLGYKQNFVEYPTIYPKSNIHSDIIMVKISNLMKRKRNIAAKDGESIDDDIRRHGTLGVIGAHAA
ncbi:uncharacterized protein LOC105425803 [Pogonomyrmex barbatus]|uniref:Uncharacterized protein LOC105425803 n=1 Tax=Pogonomyrmex barbatus TaxID=144034 RepID=A0A6I9WSX8_9HYME|nr:uncharacterized protein LOC105425803 [Pogonomyrmex barbatus]